MPVAIDWRRKAGEAFWLSPLDQTRELHPERTRSIPVGEDLQMVPHWTPGQPNRCWLTGSVRRPAVVRTAL